VQATKCETIAGNVPLTLLRRPGDDVRDMFPGGAVGKLQVLTKIHGRRFVCKSGWSEYDSRFAVRAS